MNSDNILPEISRTVMIDSLGYGQHCPLKVGQTWNIDGKKCKLVKGRYWGHGGNISNFWHWKEINKDGDMVGTESTGYGHWNDWVLIEEGDGHEHE